ncbi:RluA family pseudouridine synthase [Blautia sp. HCP3S3_G3]|uniref:RluA family pseudouridine synthase n=1 Tax=Blautia sp. HCP3S3_G3 TaxID=3438913 RepID=UPI003F891B7D
MDRIVNYQIEDKDAGTEILSFLRSRGFSRHILTGMKADKHAILLNSQRGYGHSLLKTGDQLQVRILETESSSKIIPIQMEFSILYEDEDILVINKPANMPIHPSLGNYENTLANGVAFYYAQKGESFVYRCVNRLDRDTTGALILAKNALSAAILSRQMRNRQIRRTYLALVEGIPPERGTVSAPIARVEGSTIEREVNYESGESAVTHFERLAVGNGCSLVELHLETGRTHQIRVHMKHLGYPLPGDYLYHPVYDRIRRQPLHSYQLSFTHPLTGDRMLFTAPVPDDFQKAFFYPEQPDYLSRESVRSISE